MENNKNLENEVLETGNTEEVQAETAEQAKTEKTEEKEVKKEKKEKKEKPQKPKKIKNKALFKRGGYALAVTAAVLAGLIVFNVLVSALADRFNLEFDMSTDKINTISKENREYIEGIETPVTVTVCADKESYVGGTMEGYAQYYHNATSANAGDYFKQTLNLIDKYADYNKNIKVVYVDTQDTEFTKITSKYPNDNIAYGDIIVTAGEEGTERYKVIRFDDVYNLTDESGYASAGYDSYTISGNKIETALTSAISYVASGETKKVVLLTGHSSSNVYDDYVENLELNNYKVEINSSKLVTSIPEDADAVLIVAPTADFMGSELDIIADFLDNEGELSKGLVFFADATAPYLPNLYDFLSQWGISVGEGILFETNNRNHMENDPTTMGIYPEEDSLTSGMEICITGYNVPITAEFESEDSITVSKLMSTTETVVNAPVGTPKDWTGADDYEKKSYAGVIQAMKRDYNDDNKEIKSYVMAFSSIEYIYSDYANDTRTSNRNISLAAMSRATGREDTGISFYSKTITNESFASSVTAASTKLVRIIFMISLPIITLAAGLYIYIRRRNA